MMQAHEITLYELEERLNLQVANDVNFFTEWLEPIALTEEEKTKCDRIRSQFMRQVLYRRKTIEVLVKMLVLSPLLDVAGFYQDPFDISAEDPIIIDEEDNNEPVRGRLDVLVFNSELWIAVIEAKGLKFSTYAAIPQTLAYMYASPNSQAHPTFGMVTNGNNFLFLKMEKSSQPEYAWSAEFSLLDPRENSLYEVLGILKHLATKIS
jgi:hypothetical protein